MDICKGTPQSSEWEAVKKSHWRVFLSDRDNFVTRTILSLSSLTPYILIISYIFLVPWWLLSVWSMCPQVDLVLLKGTCISWVTERVSLHPPGHESRAWSPKYHPIHPVTRRGSSLRMECRLRLAEERNGKSQDLDGIIQMHKAPGPCPPSGLPLVWENTFLYWVSQLESRFFVTWLQKHPNQYKLHMDLDESVHHQSLSEPEWFGDMALNFWERCHEGKPCILQTTQNQDQLSGWKFLLGGKCAQSRRVNLGPLNVVVEPPSGLLTKFESNL